MTASIIFFFLNTCSFFSLHVFVFSFEIDNKKDNVTIYIESYCKYSREFIEEQFKPVFSEIISEVNVNYVPFGAAEVFRNDIQNYSLHIVTSCRVLLIQMDPLGSFANMAKKK